MDITMIYIWKMDMWKMEPRILTIHVATQKIETAKRF
jgi:hypothetical protein